MPNVSDVPQYMQPVEPVETRPRLAALSYCLAFVSVQLLALAMSLYIACKPWFLDNPGTTMLRTLGYGYRAAGSACQVILFGDSNAEGDLDPAVIQAKTGLKTCNIAEFRTVIDFVGVNAPIDGYLAHNPLPEYLVTAWNPGDLNLAHKQMQTHSPEGYAYALQYDRGPWLWKGMLRSPADTLNFLVWSETSIMSSIFSKITHADTKIPDDRAQRDAQAGMWAPTRTPDTECHDDSSRWVPATFEENAKGVAAFRSRYESLGMHVIVDLAPMADCSSELRSDLQATAGLTDNSLQTLPIANFVDGVHLKRGPAVTTFSESVADQILLSMRKQQQDQAGR